MNINKRTIKSVYIVSAVLLISLLLVLFFSNDDEHAGSNPVNALRLDSNPVYEVVSNRWPLADSDIYIIEEMSKDYEIDITIVSMNETVIFSNSNSLEMTGEKLLLDAMYMDKSYITSNPDKFKISQPIYNNGTVEGFVIFEKIYQQTNYMEGLLKKIIIGFIFAFLSVIVLIAGILLFGKRSNELKVLETGLQDISKGVLRPLKTTEGNEYKHIYNAYNSLVDELTYVMKQQQSHEGQRKAFLTMISHELKTPISTISAYVEGLVSGVAGDKETREKYLSIISEKIEQLSRQVEDFFKYAQGEDNRFKYNFEELYADEVIGKIFSDLSGNQLSDTSVQNLLPKCIFSVDKIRIEQVIMNLYNNALKHTPNNEPIILRAYREDNDVVIEIEDKGEGISPKDLPYIFDYYYQGESSRKSDYEGVGLGLAICKSIMDSHRGSMRVKSKLGEGTTIYLRIPLV